MNAVTLAVGHVSQQFQYALKAPTDQEILAAIEGIKANAEQMVRDAVMGSMGALSLWYGTLGNNDDQIGTLTRFVNSDSFKASTTLPLDEWWRNDNGAWAIKGTITGAPPCPAFATAQLVNRTTHGEDGAQPYPQTVTNMREFRAGGFTELPGLQRWWDTLSRHVPAIVRSLEQSESSQHALHTLFTDFPEPQHLEKTPLTNRQIQALGTLLQQMETDPVLARSFARRGLRVLDEVQGKTWQEAMALIAEHRPVANRQR